MNVYTHKNSYDVYVSSSCFDSIPKGAIVPVHVLGSFSDGCMYNVKVVFDSGHRILYPII